MSDVFSALMTDQKAFIDLLDTVKIKESHMGVATSPGVGQRALENMGKTQLTIGHPRDNLVRLTPKLFKAVGVNLDLIQKTKLKSENFYYMTIAISMVPGDAVVYDQLKCTFALGLKGNNTPIIHSIFPNSEWKEIMKWGGKLNLDLKADLSWGLGLDLSNTNQLQIYDQLPQDIKVKVNNKNQYKGFIVIPAFSYEMGRADIVAVGPGSDTAIWDIQKPEIKQTQWIKFGIIFKVPKTTKKITINGRTTARVSKNWWFSNLKPLLNSFSKSQQEWIGDGSPLDISRTWQLDLPT